LRIELEEWIVAGPDDEGAYVLRYERAANPDDPESADVEVEIVVSAPELDALRAILRAARMLERAGD
jgi:hypothetical protein